MEFFTSKTGVVLGRELVWVHWAHKAVFYIVFKFSVSCTYIVNSRVDSVMVIGCTSLVGSWEWWHLIVHGRAHPSGLIGGCVPISTLFGLHWLSVSQITIIFKDFITDLMSYFVGHSCSCVWFTLLYWTW